MLIQCQLNIGNKVKFWYVGAGRGGHNEFGMRLPVGKGSWSFKALVKCCPSIDSEVCTYILAKLVHLLSINKRDASSVASMWILKSVWMTMGLVAQQPLQGIISWFLSYSSSHNKWWVFGPQVSCSDLTEREGTWITVTIMAARVTCPIDHGSVWFMSS